MFDLDRFQCTKQNLYIHYYNYQPGLTIYEYNFYYIQKNIKTIPLNKQGREPNLKVTKVFVFFTSIEKNWQRQLPVVKDNSLYHIP